MKKWIKPIILPDPPPPPIPVEVPVCAYCCETTTLKRYSVYDGASTVTNLVCDDCVAMLELNGFILTILS